MQAVRPIDMILLDDVFEMCGGYVLDFTDRPCASFLRES